MIVIIIYFILVVKSENCKKCDKISKGVIECKLCSNDAFGLIYDEKSCLSKSLMKDEYLYDEELKAYRSCSKYVDDCLS